MLPAAADPAAAPAAPAAPAVEPLYGWVFLTGLAAIIAVVDPIVVDLQPRLWLSAALVVAGAALIALGQWRGQILVRWAGIAVLWAVVIAGIATQISPLAQVPGQVWGPRGLLICIAVLGWTFFLSLPPWLRNGVVAVAIPTIALFAILWATAPPYSRNALVYWLAADSHGTLYANDVDNGAIWVFQNGGAIGKLWPRRGTVGQPGPGFVPVGAGSEITTLSGLGPQPTPSPNGISEHEFLFCGLAVDPQDHLYVADPEYYVMRVFAPNGQLTATWPLPRSFIPGRGCLAADQDHVYLGDNHAIIYVYDHAGRLQQEWDRDDLPIGMSSAGNGRLLVLQQKAVVTLSYPSGQEVNCFALPAPQGDLQIPYQAILGLPDGGVIVTDVSANLVRPYGPDHQPLPTFGGHGGWPGQFAGPAGLAADAEGNIYVSDFISHVIQRFTPNGAVTAVWASPEDEPGAE